MQLKNWGELSLDWGLGEANMEPVVRSLGQQVQREALRTKLAMDTRRLGGKGGEAQGRQRERWPWSQELSLTGRDSAQLGVLPGVT